MDNKVELGALFFPTKDGNGKSIDWDSLFIPYIYKEVYLEGIFVDVVSQQTDLVILDIGANIGCTVQYFRKYAKKVYAVEPLSDHFEALKKNKEFNHWDNVEVFKAAIAGTDREVTMARNPGNRTCASYVNNYRGDKETVRGVAMDTFFKENNIDHVDFCKFDVEAAEDDILRSEGFKNVCEKIKSIEVEFHLPSWPSLVEYMQGLGYQAKRYESSAIIVLFTR